ncbi:acyltransferase [Enterococcus gilvus]|uniref:acyltransferase n=1 Tax=Enterococcus gilvus TaxID=160453 RepID=UPI003D6B9B46
MKLNKYISKEVTYSDKIQILFFSFLKLIRGSIKKPLFKKTEGFLFIGRRVNLLNKKNLKFGKNCKIEHGAEIQGLAKETIIFGNYITIGAFSMIRPSSYYGTGEIGMGLEMGDNSSIGPYCYIGCAGKIQIGKNVMIGPRVTLIAENHNFKKSDELIKNQGVTQKGIVIEDDCWIGTGVVVLDGVRIGKGSVIGGGTIVTKNIPENSVVIDKKEKLIKSKF